LVAPVLRLAGQVSCHRPRRDIGQLTDIHEGQLVREMIEFALPHAADERRPLRRREPEYRAGGVLAVPDADTAVRQTRHLYAVAIGEAQRALDPG
jgi:hypothetical protein